MEINIAKKCPYCNYVLRVKKPQVGNLSIDPDISKKITSGSFFEYKCPRCGNTIKILFPFVYIDEKRSLFIKLMTREEDQQSAISVVCENAGKYKHIRMVPDYIKMGEIITAFEHNKDDRIIELCKYSAKLILEREKPDFITKEIVYFSDPNNPNVELFYFVDTNNKSLYYRLNIGEYNMLFLKFYNIVEKEYKHSLLFDLSFAKEFFESHKEELIKNSTNLMAKLVSTNKTITSDIFRCRKCGAKVEADELFCPKCGTVVKVENNMKYCKDCGKRIDVGAIVCEYCGKSLKK